MKNKHLASIFLVVFIDLLGFSLILPLLPYYAKTFNANGITTGLLVASYAVMQLIGAPILGRLSDRFGRRPILLASILGSFLGFLLLASAQSLWMLFAARMLDGITGGNLSVAQAYITDVTDEKNRAKGLGMIGAAFGLGFIIGPVTGGVLSQWGYSVPALAAALLSFINLLLVFFWLPESLTPARRANFSITKMGINSSALASTLRRPFTGSILITRFFFGLVFAIFQTIFSLYALVRFNLSAAQTGYILTYVGVLLVFTQGYLIRRLTNRIREDLLIFISVMIMALCMLGWAIVPSVAMLMVLLAPMSVVGGLLNTSLSSILTKTVTRQEVGGILGISSSVESLTRVVAPILGAALLSSLGSWAPGIFGFFVLVGLSLFVRTTILKNPVFFQKPPAEPVKVPIVIDEES